MSKMEQTFTTNGRMVDLDPAQIRLAVGAMKHSLERQHHVPVEQLDFLNDRVSPKAQFWILNTALEIAQGRIPAITLDTAGYTTAYLDSARAAVSHGAAPLKKQISTDGIAVGFEQRELRRLELKTNDPEKCLKLEAVLRETGDRLRAANGTKESMHVPVLIIHRLGIGDQLGI